MEFLNKYKIKTLGGLNNKNFLLNYFGNFYVLRIPSLENENNFNVEHNSIQLLSSSNLIPKIIYHNKDSGIMLSKYIKDTEFNFTLFKSKATLKNLALSLNKFHNISIENFPLFNPFYEIDKNFSFLQKQNYKFNHNIRSFLDRKSHIFSTYKDSNILKLCHNDLNTSNILFKKDKLFFIDFEFIGLNDPFFDLATLSWFLTEEERIFLLSEYLGREPKEFEKNKLVDFLYIVKLWNASWSFKKALENKDSIYDYEVGGNLILDDLS
ncbi:MAG: phosphotransferase [Clostridium sp.]|uniref:phosphotransferase n=1 Tax=Clostridium sp. TaxID=1506 RepID=UPI003F2E0E18